MKKNFFVLVQCICIFTVAFSSQYEEKLEITDIEIVQSLDGNCCVIYKTIDNTVRMFIENFHEPKLCGEVNLFRDSNNIKATSSFYSKEGYTRFGLCFTGVDTEGNNKLYVFSTGASINDYFSKSISFINEERLEIKDIIFSDTDELSIYLTINDILYCQKINLNSKQEELKICFMGHEVNEMKICKREDTFYGIFSAKDGLYIYMQTEDTEYIQKITDEEDFFYCLDEEKNLCYITDGKKITKIIFEETVNTETISVDINVKHIKDIITIDEKTILILRGENKISSSVIDFEKQLFLNEILCSYEKEPFVYIEKNKLLIDSIILIVKDDAVYSLDNLCWNKIINYQEFSSKLNPKLITLQQEDEKYFEIRKEKSHIDNNVYYVAQIDKERFIPLYENINDETYLIVKNSRSINNFFYTVIKKDDVINILSRRD